MESRSSVYCLSDERVTRAWSSSGSNGLLMKSSAPAWKPRNLVLARVQAGDEPMGSIASRAPA